ISELHDVIAVDPCVYLDAITSCSSEIRVRYDVGIPGSRSVRLKAPHSAAAVCTPAAFPASTSCTESPTKMALSGGQSSRWSAIRTGSGSGLCREDESQPTM